MGKEEQDFCAVCMWAIFGPFIIAAVFFGVIFMFTCVFAVVVTGLFSQFSFTAIVAIIVLLALFSASNAKEDVKFTVWAITIGGLAIYGVYGLVVSIRTTRAIADTPAGTYHNPITQVVESPLLIEDSSCDWIGDIKELTTDFDNFLFGQHIVYNTVLKSLAAHSRSDKSTKPLMLYFHGEPGTGKTHVANMIARRMYKLTTRNQNIHVFKVEDFLDGSNIIYHVKKVKERVDEMVKGCSRSLFIFEDVEKIPIDILYSLQFLVNNDIDIDYGKSIFIFMSSDSDKLNRRLSNNFFSSGRKREDLKLKDFENEILDAISTKEDQDSHVLYSKMIDHYVPFLPLGMDHVQQCVNLYLRENGRSYLMRDQKLIAGLLEELKMNKEDEFALSGCKLVAVKTAKLIEMDDRQSARDAL